MSNLAERFQKTYIPVNEFISSWEKEIYELTNLDYFTFVLINELGYRIEHEYFGKRCQSPYLEIDHEDIGTLVFNIGDSFESFLENNCFGDCSQSCPSRLQDNMEIEPEDLPDESFYILRSMENGGMSKKQYLLADILNYVVIDTLFDFYNYEIGLNLNDADAGLLDFADFVTDVVERIFDSKNAAYLETPNESATVMFENLIRESENNWDDYYGFADEDEVEEIEAWKHKNTNIGLILDRFLESNTLSKTQIDLVQQLRRFSSDYAGVVRIDEFTIADLDEFMGFYLIREIAFERNLDGAEIILFFERLLDWLELNYEYTTESFRDRLINGLRFDFELAIELNQAYRREHSTIEGLLETNRSEEELTEGIFEIVRIGDNGFFRLREVLTRKEYINVRVDVNFTAKELQGFLVEGTVKPTMYGWRLIDADFIYPPQARPFLR